MMREYTKVAHISHGRDIPIAVRLFAGFDRTVHIDEDWMDFIARIALVYTNECVLRFKRFGWSTTIVVSDF